MSMPVRKAPCHPNWGGKVSNQEAYVRAGGRRHWQRIRKIRALERKQQVLKLAMQYGYPRQGVQSRIARELNVHKSTICLDLQGLFQGDTIQKLEEKYSKKKK